LILNELFFYQLVLKKNSFLCNPSFNTI